MAANKRGEDDNGLQRAIHNPEANEMYCSGGCSSVSYMVQDGGFYSRMRGKDIRGKRRCFRAQRALVHITVKTGSVMSSIPKWKNVQFGCNEEYNLDNCRPCYRINIALLRCSRRDLFAAAAFVSVRWERSVNAWEAVFPELPLSENTWVREERLCATWVKTDARGGTQRIDP
ncbi:hypothetical protein B0H19DRAFT_1070114 [Mycena capillaripes]|nr:hypothetical protein B0H19DRAFT_1070114 [Mycena capillaripes]